VAASDADLKTATLDYTYDDLPLTTIGNCIDSLSFEAISPDEEAALMQMREEEFLTHDVYQAFSQLYTKPVFVNISKSELKRTNSIKGLLDKYQVPDPAANHVTGTCTDPALQMLYMDLVSAGSQPLLDALIVGATIEDLDIADFQDFLRLHWAVNDKKREEAVSTCEAASFYLYKYVSSCNKFVSL